MNFVDATCKKAYDLDIHGGKRLVEFVVKETATHIDDSVSLISDLTPVVDSLISQCQEGQPK